MKRLGVLLLPWMGCQSIANYLPAFCRRYPFGERQHEIEVFCPRTQHSDPGQGSNPDRSVQTPSSALTIRPPRLPQKKNLFNNTWSAIRLDRRFALSNKRRKPMIKSMIKSMINIVINQFIFYIVSALYHCYNDKVIFFVQIR